VNLKANKNQKTYIFDEIYFRVLAKKIASVEQKNGL